MPDSTILPTPTPQVTGKQETLSEWAGPYVTQMLGKARALADTPYQVYGGRLTAGPSALQNQLFRGLGSLGFPSLLGQSFAGPATSGFGGIGSPGQPMTVDKGEEQARLQKMLQGSAQPGPGLGGAIPDAAPDDPRYGGPGIPGYDNVPYGGGRPQATSMMPYGGGQQPQSMAERYMNPYMQQVLAPQMQAMQRQADIQRNMLGSQAAKVGAFGGARAGLMGSQLNADLMRQQQQATGQAYGTAYDKAMQQFNTEQDQARALANMMAGAGAQQRDITQQGIAADLAEFQAQRDYPYKQLQFMQSMLQGLPIQSLATSYQQPNSLANTMNTMGGLMTLYKQFGGK